MTTTYETPGVYVREEPPGSRPIQGVGTAIAGFVGMVEKADGYEGGPVLVTDWSGFTRRFGGTLPGSYLAHAVYGFFNNGGGRAYIVAVGAPSKGAPTARAALPSASHADTETYRIEAAAEDVGTDLTVEVTDASSGPSEDVFALKVRRGDREEETFDALAAKRGLKGAAQEVTKASTLVRLADSTSVGAEVLRRPANGVYSLQRPPTAGIADFDGPAFEGDVSRRTGLAALQAVDEITMLCVPDLMAAYEQGSIDVDGVKAVQRAMVDQCELLRDRMAILDPLPGYDAQAIGDWRRDSVVSSPHATLYWPWIRVVDPATGELLAVPPSGHVAGVWGRSDDSRGVHKAPANEAVRGAIDLAFHATRGEQGVLNPLGVNCLRAFPARGIRVWGARTLAEPGPWQYVNVRRLFNYVAESVMVGTDWAVFEPNDPELWGRLRRTVTAFLLRLWRDGALLGNTPEEAFFVKCDAETNPREDIDAGIVNVRVGIAPVRPAEFVVFTIEQIAGGAQVAG